MMAYLTIVGAGRVFAIPSSVHDERLDCFIYDQLVFGGQFFSALENVGVINTANIIRFRIRMLSVDPPSPPGWQAPCP